MFKQLLQLKNFIFFTTVFFFFPAYAHLESDVTQKEKTIIASKDLWTSLKYQEKKESEKIHEIKSLLNKIKEPSTRSELAWLFMIEATLASYEGGLEAISRLSNLVDRTENYFLEPQSVEDFMICSIMGYLHLKVPGWPLGFGSKKTAKKWLKKAHGMEYEPDVAFYLAHAYERLGHTKQAQLFAQVSFDGFSKKTNSYELGKISELKSLKYFKANTAF